MSSIAVGGGGAQPFARLGHRIAEIPHGGGRRGHDVEHLHGLVAEDARAEPPVVGPVDDVTRAELEGAALPFDRDTTPQAEVDLLAGADVRAPLDPRVFLAEGPAAGGARIRPEDAGEKTPCACRSLVLPADIRPL